MKSKSGEVRNAIRRALSAIAVCTVLAPLPGFAAQDSPRLGRVEVTGSRIKRAAIEGQTPVAVINRSDIEKSGLDSLGDLLQQLTASGSALNTRFNSSGNFGFPPDGSGVGAGATTVDLRHLGAKRVLVLVDGIRWVSEASASGVSSATDLGTIPLAIIDRIEILEDGASSIYGSDAIAGVVNIITRRGVDGVAMSLHSGAYARGGDTRAGELSFGHSSGDFDLFVAASHSEQNAISSTAYANAAVPVPGTGLTFGSSATPNGRFHFVDPDSGEEVDLTTPNGQYFSQGPRYPDDFIDFTDANRFNFAPYNLLLTPNRRDSLYTQLRFEFNDDASGYLRAMFNRRDSANEAAPEPIFLGPDAGTGNAWADDILIAADNPHNPFGFDLVSSGDDANLILIGRRPVEGGPRRFLQRVDTWYFATGLEGVFDVGDRSLYWDFNYARSRNQAEQTNYGSYNIRRINLALGPLADCNANPQCVPLDIFGGPGSITPAMLAFIQPVIHDSSNNQLELVSANLSGDMFELAAGPISFAAGYEHRRLEGRYRPDPLTVAGEYNGVPSLPTRGAYEVDELYAEFSVPVYANERSHLDLSAAARYSDYSTSGGETTGKLGFRWQFSDEFLLRGSAAQGFRAPSIGELFGAAARFDAVIDDPCLIGLDGSAADADCSAFGVPAGARQANGQISITTGGNAELQPETADSYSLGFVYSPQFGSNALWSDRFDLEFTWYRHELDGAIQAIDAQTQLDLCVAEGPASPFCADIGRAATGAINRFDNRLRNFGSIETDGYDLDLIWTLPEFDVGQFGVNWKNTWVAGYRAVDGFGAEQPRRVGRELNDSAIPRWTSTLDLDWRYRDFDASWTLRHLGVLREDCGDAASFAVCSDPASATNRLGATTYHDLQIGWNPDSLDATRLSIGVRNLFAKQPPVCLSCSLNGYDASTYDLPAGRFVYARIDLRF